MKAKVTLSQKCLNGSRCNLADLDYSLKWHEVYSYPEKIWCSQGMSNVNENRGTTVVHYNKA